MDGPMDTLGLHDVAVLADDPARLILDHEFGWSEPLKLGHGGSSELGRLLGELSLEFVG